RAPATKHTPPFVIIITPVMQLASPETRKTLIALHRPAMVEPGIRVVRRCGNRTRIPRQFRSPRARPPCPSSARGASYPAFEFRLNILCDLRDESMNSSQAKKQPYPCMRKRRVLVGSALLALAFLLIGAASFPMYGALAAAEDDAAIAMRLADLLRSARTVI